MVTRKVHRKLKSHSKTKHGKRKTRKQNKRHRRRTRVIRGGGGQHFQGAKVWNPQTGGNVYELNKNISHNPESETFGPIKITPSIYDNHGNPDVLMKDLPAQTGGRRRRRRTNRKQKKGRKQTGRRKNKRTRRRRRRSSMRGGSGGSTVCPTCPNSDNKTGPSSPGFSDFVPQAIKDAYRGTVDTIENTSNAFAGKAPINDDSNISNQPIAKNITDTPPNITMPHNVGKIMHDSQTAVAGV